MAILFSAVANSWNLTAGIAWITANKLQLTPVLAPAAAASPFLSSMKRFQPTFDPHTIALFISTGRRNAMVFFNSTLLLWAVPLPGMSAYPGPSFDG